MTEWLKEAAKTLDRKRFWLELHSDGVRVVCLRGDEVETKLVAWEEIEACRINPILCASEEMMERA